MERVKERLAICLTEIVIYDELAGSFTRLQTEGREFIARVSQLYISHPSLASVG